MKVLDYLESLPKGAVITNKRVLALFKRLGFIYDYSQFGYLESQWYYQWTSDGKGGLERWKNLTYSGKGIKDGDKGSFENPFGKDEDTPSSSLWFEYKGVKFSSKYLSGCFNAYLEKVSDNAEKTEVNPTMSLWGTIL